MNLLVAFQTIGKHVLLTKIEKFRKFDLFFSLHFVNEGGRRGWVSGETSRCVWS